MSRVGGPVWVFQHSSALTKGSKQKMMPLQKEENISSFLDEDQQDNNRWECNEWRLISASCFAYVIELAESVRWALPNRQSNNHRPAHGLNHATRYKSNATVFRGLGRWFKWCTTGTSQWGSYQVESEKCGIYAQELPAFLISQMCPTVHVLSEWPDFCQWSAMLKDSNLGGPANSNFF